MEKPVRVHLDKRHTRDVEPVFLLPETGPLTFETYQKYVEALEQALTKARAQLEEIRKIEETDPPLF